MSESRRSPYVAIGFTTLLALGLIVYVSTQAESTVVGALSGTTSLLLLAVFTIVNVVLPRPAARHRRRRSSFVAPTAFPVMGAIFCAYLLGPWARLEEDMVQYKIAARAARASASCCGR